MSKFVPILKIAVLASLGVLGAAVILNLVLGQPMSAAPMMPGILGGLLAWRFLNAPTAVAAPHCPTCATQQPAWRKPVSFRQALFGGWTCAHCGTQMNRKGHAIAQENGNHA